jgi:hypothetical protein
MQLAREHRLAARGTGACETRSARNKFAPRWRNAGLILSYLIRRRGPFEGVIYGYLVKNNRAATVYATVPVHYSNMFARSLSPER